MKIKLFLIDCFPNIEKELLEEIEKFSEIVEIDSQLLLLPINRVDFWLKKYLSFSSIILSNCQKQYKNLLNTTKQILCYNLEDRLINYSKTKAQIKKSNILTVSHQNIADDLGTSREVIKVTQPDNCYKRKITPRICTMHRC